MNDDLRQSRRHTSAPRPSFIRAYFRMESVADHLRRYWRAMRGALLGLNFVAQRGISSIVQIAAIPLLISALGTEGYGAFVILASLWNWGSLADFGIGTAFQVEMSHRRVAGRPYDTAILAVCLLSLALPLLLAPVAALFGYFLGPYFLEPFHTLGLGEMRWLTTLALLLSVCSVCSALVYRVWLAEFRSQLYSLALSLGPLGGIGAVWVVDRLVVHQRFSWIIIAYWLPAIVIGVVALIAQMYRPVSFRARTLIGEIILVLRHAPRYLCVNLGYIAVNQVDMFIMSRIGTVDDLVQYAIAQKIFSGIYLAYNAILMAYGPYCSEAMFKKQWASVNRIMRRQVVIGCAAAVLACTLFIWFGHTIIAVLMRRTVTEVPESVWIAGLFMVVAKMWVDTFGGVLSNARITGPILACLPIQAVFSAVFQYALGSHFGGCGIFLGMALGYLVTSGWVFPLAMLRHQRGSSPTTGLSA